MCGSPTARYRPTKKAGIAVAAKPALVMKWQAGGGRSTANHKHQHLYPAVLAKSASGRVASALRVAALIVSAHRCT
jgi:hypothetical protein